MFSYPDADADDGRVILLFNFCFNHLVCLHQMISHQN